MTATAHDTAPTGERSAGAMRFGTVCLWRSDSVAYGREVELADELGFDMICGGDSQSVYREVYVGLAVAAMRTRGALLGPMVTNPITRHPAVTASAIATIDELSGGRAILGIGTGDSAIRNLGEKAATLAALREYVVALRGLLRGETVGWRGRAIHTSWVRRAVPIYISAEGPRTLELAGAVADGVVMHTGTTPEIVADSIAHVRRGAEAAGRDPDTIDIWAMLKGNVADTRQQAIDEIKMGLAGSAHHAFRLGLEGKHVPERLQGPVLDLVHRYDTRAHEVWDGANASISDELGITEYLADRFALVGTPDECIARVAALRDAGLRQLIVPALGPDPLRVLRRFGEEVFPRFREASVAARV
ncbi:MAG TPA: LLM class flavin-dependent oxidoreductase [Acidimicrobiales bacterium]|nr:LLM class flavin-dependent oxidoreductase [Acidimicrobiales bacterium]